MRYVRIVARIFVCASVLVGTKGITRSGHQHIMIVKNIGQNVHMTKSRFQTHTDCTESKTVHFKLSIILCGILLMDHGRVKTAKDGEFS